MGEIAGRTGRVAQAMHNTRLELGRAERLLDADSPPTRPELIEVRDRLMGNGRQLRDALGHVDALREIPAYGELKHHVESVERLAKETERGVDAVAANPAALRETRDRLRPGMAAARVSVQFAITTANEARDLAKTAEAATNPTPTSAQHAPGSAQPEVRNRPDGQSQSPGVQL
ncbi:hypothetical protein [Kribbella sp. NPDC004875]|uniref:hypothetical protein n=1 Tax=Kribbella sp. NPDC004875 TaxID=3364107 RepID=UPI0036A97AAB